MRIKSMKYVFFAVFQCSTLNCLKKKKKKKFCKLCILADSYDVSSDLVQTGL